MFLKYSAIPLKGSTSMAVDNLSIVSLSKEKLSAYAVVGKGCVFLTYIDQVNNEVTNKQIIPKVPKEASSESSGGIFSTIHEAKFLRLADRTVLVILNNRGIFFYDSDGEHLLFFHSLNVREAGEENAKTKQACVYARGITAVMPNIVAIGSSTGIILLFEVPSRGNHIVLRNELRDKYLQSAITALASDADGNLIFASDSTGNIIAFNIKTFNNIKTYRLLKEEDKISCTCMAVWNNYLFCAMETGVISMFEVNHGVKVIDMCAHARWINSLDVKNDRLVSCSEDCFFRVWDLTEINGKLKLNCAHSERVADSMMCAAHFNAKSDDICVSVFEESEILLYKMT